MISIIKRTALLTAMVSFLSTANAQDISVNWEAKGFEQPESVVSNDELKQIYVSNISGTPVEANGKGFISLLSPAGEIIKQRWISGMNAPKGMAQSGNFLYVADLQKIHIIDIEKAEIVQSIIANNSKMLNDVTIDEVGNVYVSDLLGGGIYKLADNKLTQWIEPSELPHTNGVLTSNDQLIVATWGEGMKADFTTEVLGGLFSINLTSKEITPLENAQTFGNLDGLVNIDGTLYINDWINGDLFSYKNKKLTKVFNLAKGAADIGTDGKNLLVPEMTNGKVNSYSLKHIK